MRQDIEERFNTEAKALPALRERFAAAVTRWMYSTVEIWNYEHMKYYTTEDSALPDSEGAFCACGFDASNRPIYLQEFETNTVFGKPGSNEPAYQKVPTKNLEVEEFITHHGDTLEVTKVLRGQLHAICRKTFDNHLLVEEELFQDGHYQHTRCQYEQRRMVLQQSISDRGHVFFEIQFGPSGEQSYFRVRSDGTRFQLYQPWPKGVTLKSVKETIRTRLLACVPQVIAKAELKEPIYSVALAYDGEGNDPLPPLIGVGLESERQRWLTEHGKDAWQWVWNPAEFQHYEKSHTQLEDEELEEACDLLNSKLAERDSVSPAVRLLVEVATELNRFSWPEAIQRTSDFVVYAVDYELSSLRKSLKASLPAERLAILRAKKLI